MLITCLLPAQARENNDIPISDAVTAMVIPDDTPAQAGDLILLASRRAPVTDTTGIEIDHTPAPVARAKAVLRDLRPFGNNFFVGGGTYKGDRDLGLGTPLQRDVSVGDVSFPVDEYGPVESRIGYDETVPFVGGGFTRTYNARGRIDMKVLAGAAFYGSGALEQEALSEDKTARTYEVQPMLQVGVSYKF
ncbi:MAG: hypothetical protein KDA53_03585 [Hyphomonas sp.]|nr:hypothetical protein [Hyphomonas sp.]